MPPKRHIGDGVFVEIDNGLFLVTCEAPSRPNAMYMDGQMIQSLIDYRDEAYNEMRVAIAGAQPKGNNG